VVILVADRSSLALMSIIGDWQGISGDELGLNPWVAWNQGSSMVAGEDVREIGLEKLTQDPGDEFSGMLASGPNCICDGTTCRGLFSGIENAPLSTSRPELRL